MVDKKPLADFSPGVNLDPGKEPSEMRGEAAQQEKLALPEKMGDPIEKHGMKAGVAKDDLDHTANSRVTLEYCLDIFA
jgi:hypothetical protein